MGRDASDIQADIDAWEEALTAAAKAKSASFSTATSSESIQYQSVDDINAILARLRRELEGVTTGQRHAYGVANFNNEANQ